MKDNYGREISYLRMSVTDRCNLRCLYCMPEEGIQKKEHKNILRNEDFVQIAKVAIKLGINKFRITGGEPLVRKGIVSLCDSISNLKGIDSLNMTTNGILLPEFCDELKSAGVKRLNISIDSLNEDKYRHITRGGSLETVLLGLEKAKAKGFGIKINTVLMKGINSSEINDFIRLAREYDIEVRFIELMPLGESVKIQKDTYVNSFDIINNHSELILLENSEGVAEKYKIEGGYGQIGFIRPMSKSFCSECNRLRITADGKIKPCLHSNREICLKSGKNYINMNNEEKEITSDIFTEQQIKESLIEAILGKPKDMKNAIKMESKNQQRNMNQIGG